MNRLLKDSVAGDIFEGRGSCALSTVLVKVFRTTTLDVITEYRHWFGLLEMETLVAKRTHRFLAKYSQCDNILCQLFAQVESVTI